MRIPVIKHTAMINSKDYYYYSITNIHISVSDFRTIIFLIPLYDSSCTRGPAFPIAEIPESIKPDSVNAFIKFENNLAYISVIITDKCEIITKYDTNNETLLLTYKDLIQNTIKEVYTYIDNDGECYILNDGLLCSYNKSSEQWVVCTDKKVKMVEENKHESTSNN